MLKDSHGRRLWIMDEFGQHTPVKNHRDIQDRPRGRDWPDWWVVAKDPTWTPPEPRSLLSLGITDSGSLHTISGSGGHTQLGAGHKPQAYDEHGRYTGPGGFVDSPGDFVPQPTPGDISDEPDAADPEYNFENTAAADDAMDVGDGMSGAAPGDNDAEADAPEQEADPGEQGDTETGSGIGDALELTDVLLADSGRVDTDAGGGLNGGIEVRGPVVPPAGNGPPIPPPPKEPHLVYSQSTGEMKGPDGKPLATGYAGRGGGLNNPDAEGLKAVGPLPQGNWRMKELDEQTCKEKGWPTPAYRLTPDEDTRARVEALGRDPDSFYVHATARYPVDRGRESQGCIALDIPEREALRAYKGRWIRVER